VGPKEGWWNGAIEVPGSGGARTSLCLGKAAEAWVLQWRMLLVVSAMPRLAHCCHQKDANNQKIITSSSIVMQAIEHRKAHGSPLTAAVTGFFGQPCVKHTGSVTASTMTQATPRATAAMLVQLHAACREQIEECS
jgi:hypothetical protein